MPGTTAKGVPYSLGADAASTIDDTSLLVANWIDARPGIAVMDRPGRNALAGVDLWTGRVIFNTTVARCEMRRVDGSWAGTTVADVMSDVTRDALVAADKWIGRIIYNSTSGAIQVWDGAVWQTNADIPVLTTVQRNALAGDDLWAGEIVWDSTQKSIYVYDGAACQQAGGGSFTWAKTFMFMGS